MREDAMVFGTLPSLVGVMTQPDTSESDPVCPAVILLNSGRVHRVGPSRLYVKIARRLAAAGFVVLRFDFSGIGDSNARRDHLPFNQSVIQETQSAMQYVSEVKVRSRFILLGICSGAHSALVTASCDPRVVGVVLINAQPVPGEELGATLSEWGFTRYFWRIVCHPQLWLSILRQEWKNGLQHAGKLIYIFSMKACWWRKNSMHEAMEEAAAYVTAHLRPLMERRTRMLFVYSEGDLGIDYMQTILGKEIAALKSHRNVDVHVVPRSDHSFTAIQSQESLTEIILNWSMANFKNCHISSVQDKECFKTL